MPLSKSRDYLSIGEVLDALRPEFPDISISKIRFLESEGLISPERTGAGYRKFYDADVARLRYILSLQRDHFMPLRVIRERLSAMDADGEGLSPPGAPDGALARADAAPREPDPVELTRERLLSAAGLSEQQLGELEDYGVVRPRSEGSYDADDLALARAARGLFDYGVEPRHLRVFRQMGEREAAFIEQIVSPVTKKRDPAAAQEAAHAARVLAGLCRQVRDAVVHSSVRDLL